MEFARRVGGLRQEGAYRVLAKAQELERRGRDVIHLEIGEPDFATPGHIAEAGMEAIRGGKTRYNPPRGTVELREAVALAAGAQRNLRIDPDRVVVGPGAKPFLFFPALAVVDPGDEVLYPDPGFPTYEAVIEAAGGVPVPVPLVEENSFAFDLDAFDRLVSNRTRLVILNSPGNPTGGVMPLENLEHIARAALRRDLWVLSDEIYSRLVYDGRKAPTIAALDGMSERTIIVDGFSKTYAMTGWRLGYAVMPTPLAEKVQLLLTHAVGCTAQFTQVAGVEALKASQECVDAMVREYAERRAAMTAGLNAIDGITCPTPEGAFYVFPNVSAFGMKVGELADRILEETGVALLPGTSFGANGEGYLRLAYANSVENIGRAVGRLGDFFGSVTHHGDGFQPISM